MALSNILHLPSSIRHLLFCAICVFRVTWTPYFPNISLFADKMAKSHFCHRNDVTDDISMQSESKMLQVNTFPLACLFGRQFLIQELLYEKRPFFLQKGLV